MPSATSCGLLGEIVGERLIQKQRPRHRLDGCRTRPRATPAAGLCRNRPLAGRGHRRHPRSGAACDLQQFRPGLARAAASVLHIRPSRHRSADPDVCAGSGALRCLGRCLRDDIAARSRLPCTAALAGKSRSGRLFDGCSTKEGLSATSQPNCKPGKIGSDWQAYARYTGRADLLPLDCRWLFASHYVIALDMVRRDLGAALVPGFLAQPELEAGQLTLLDLREAPDTRGLPPLHQGEPPHRACSGCVIAGSG